MLVLRKLSRQLQFDIRYQLQNIKIVHLRVPIFVILTRNISQTFPLSSCPYVSTIPEKKTSCYRPFKNGHFVRVCTEKIVDHQFGKNGARNICPNYNHMRAYVECSLYLIDLSIKQTIDETLKIPVKYWPFLYLNVTRILQFSSTRPRL